METQDTATLVAALQDTLADYNIIPPDGNGPQASSTSHNHSFKTWQASDQHYQHWLP